MKAVLCLLITLAALARAADNDDSHDRDDIRKALAAFNDVRTRPAVLTHDADLTPLERFGGPEVSQVYFEARTIKLLTPDIAFVDAAASQYGSTIMKRAMPAYFVLRRVGGEWRVAVMRIP